MVIASVGEQLINHVCVCEIVPYRPLLRRPKFNAGPINAGPNNAGSKKPEIKEGLFSTFKGDFVHIMITSTHLQQIVWLILSSDDFSKIFFSLLKMAIQMPAP